MDDSFSSMVESTKSGGLQPPNLPSPESIKKEGMAALDQEKAARAPIMQRQEDNIKKMFDYAAKLKEQPAPPGPKMQDLPTAPNSQYKDPTQVLGSLMSVMALLGSFKTRAPATAALNSAAAAMNAFHKGDMEKVKLERQKWHDDLEKTLQQNQIEMQKYDAALKKANFDIAKARPEFEAIAASNGHDQMLIAAQHGDFVSMQHIMDGARKAGEKAADMYVKDQEFRIRQADLRAQREQTNAYRQSMLTMSREKMEDAAKIRAQKAVEAGKPTDRALEIINQMKGILETNVGVTGLAGFAKRPLESVLSMMGGPESGPAHQYESLARELQNILRQTSEFRYKGRTLSKEVADRDVMVRGLKFGDTGSISMDQLNHLENMLTGQGASFESQDGRVSEGSVKETKILDGKTYTKINGQWYPQ